VVYYLWYNKRMLSIKEKETRKQIRYVCIEDLAPENHLLRRVESAVDFSFVRDEVKEFYSEDKGRPSIDPATPVKLCVERFVSTR
jgi:transposase